MGMQRDYRDKRRRKKMRKNAQLRAVESYCSE